MRARSALLVALVTVAGLLLSACSGTSSSSAQSPPTQVLTTPTSTPTPTPPPPPPKPPRPPECYRLGYQGALAPTSSAPAVPCNRWHTAVTFYVGTYRQRLPVDGPAVHRIESTVCPRRFAAYVGGSLDTRRLSLLRTVWFTPTMSQAQRGARWFRCVAIALRGGQQLAVLSVPPQGALNGDTGRAHYGLCANAEPGTQGFEQRICSGPHSWKALRTVDFPAGRYPGEAQVKAAGQSPCQDAARAVAGNPLSYQWSYQWPTLQQWRAGQTYGVCWAPSS